MENNIPKASTNCSVVKKPFFDESKEKHTLINNHLKWLFGELNKLGDKKM